MFTGLIQNYAWPNNAEHDKIFPWPKQRHAFQHWPYRQSVGLRTAPQSRSPTALPRHRRPVPARLFHYIVMPVLLATAAFAATIVNNCSWNNPGRFPYRGTPAEAVSRYTDIPAATRAALIRKMETRDVTENVTITRDAIEGSRAYDPQITAMHFGQRTVCDRVTRERWPDTAREPAAVYCADSHCLLVPRICGNVSRIRVVEGGSGRPGAGMPGPTPIAPVAPAQPPLPGPEIDVRVTDEIALLPARPRAAAPPPAPWQSPWADSGYLWPLGTPIQQPPATISPVPEPSGWHMLAGGLLVGFAVRRRKWLAGSRKTG